MIKHFCRHIAHFLPFKLRVPYYPCPSAKINGCLCQAIVHRQTEAIAFQAQFIANGFCKSFAQGNSGILNGMVFIDV
ncbi:hypothetical protein D3C86_1890800 [compost metagenome]